MQELTHAILLKQARIGWAQDTVKMTLALWCPLCPKTIKALFLSPFHASEAFGHHYLPSKCLKLYPTRSLSQTPCILNPSIARELL